MIQVQSLTKYYGTLCALNHISFEIPTGEVTALLGLNGAGKTTCLRLLTGYLTPDEGTLTIGKKGNEKNSNQSIGYLSDTLPLYSEMRVSDYLHFIAHLRGVSKSDWSEERKRVLEITGLQIAANSLIQNLSSGYRKRTGIAQALIGSPPVLIFDEPISGLDPRQIVEIRNLIRSLAGRHTILISSHILTEVERTCDRVLVLHRGSIVGDISGDELDMLEDKFMELTSSGMIEVGG